MKRNSSNNGVKNISHLPGKSWVVRFNKNDVKVHKTFAYDPNIVNDKEQALQDAIAWRNAEWLSITHKSVSINNTSQLTLRTLLEDYLKTETPKKKGATEEESRINLILTGKLDKDETLIDTPIVKLGRDVFSKLVSHLLSRKKPLGASSINRYLAIFSSALKYAMGKDSYKWIRDEVGDLASGNHLSPPLTSCPLKS